MKNMLFGLIMLVTLVSIGCGKGKSGGNANGNPGYYNNMAGCPGFQQNNPQSPYQRRGAICTDIRSNTPAPGPQYCQYNTLNTGWTGTPGYNPPGYNPPGYNPGYNPPGYNPVGYNPGYGQPGYNPAYNNGYNPSCQQFPVPGYQNGYQNQYAGPNQYQLNYFQAGACSFLNEQSNGGTIWKEIVFPGNQTTMCVEYTVNMSNTMSQYGNPMAMNQYPGAAIGCIPGYYVPNGCNCMGAGGGGAGFQIYAGISPFGISAGVGAGAQAAGVCY